MILSDTCSVYKLYFFAKASIIPLSNIVIENFGEIKFHPLVSKEFNDDFQAFLRFQQKISQKLSTPKSFPSFFPTLQETEVQNIKQFITDNLSTIKPTEKSDINYLKRYQVFDSYRIERQKEWKDKNLFQDSKKAKSKPSHTDYLMLYDSLKHEHDFITNDEMLLDVAQAFFTDTTSLNAYTAENVIKACYENNPNLKEKIQDTIETLSYLSENFKASIVFN